MSRLREIRRHHFLIDYNNFLLYGCEKENFVYYSLEDNVSIDLMKL